MSTQSYDAIVVGGGPGGLSAAQHLAQSSKRVLVIEQNKEIGSPTRTSGGSFIAELRKLGIPESHYHPLGRGRMVSPHREVSFAYPQPLMCVIDVRRVFQLLAERAVFAGAEIRVATTFVDVLKQESKVIGVKAKDFHGAEVEFYADLVIDATGYRASVSKRAGRSPEFQRFGVGAEYDMYAPRYDQSEAVLIVGSQIAPSGYAWAFPWGNGRVRVGVGVIHADSDARPEMYLDKLVREAASYGLNLDGAQPLEYHFGLIPSDGLSKHFAADGLLAVGDAAGQASTLVGEGIRWAIMGGRMAGDVAVEALTAGDTSVRFLGQYERRWRKEYGSNLRIAQAINKRIAHWTDDEWDAGLDVLKALSPAQFMHALQSNFLDPWAFVALVTNPKLLTRSVGILARQLASAREN